MDHIQRENKIVDLLKQWKNPLNMYMLGRINKIGLDCSDWKVWWRLQDCNFNPSKRVRPQYCKRRQVITTCFCLRMGRQRLLHS